jgi:hypothetical protein
MFSPFNSLLTALILTPFVPTVAPTGSILGLIVDSATLALSPGILALEWMMTYSSLISGTSRANNSSKNFGLVLESSTCIPSFLSI